MIVCRTVDELQRTLAIYPLRLFYNAHAVRWYVQRIIPSWISVSLVEQDAIDFHTWHLTFEAGDQRHTFSYTHP